MRIRIQHRRVTIFEEPVSALIQVVRRTPRNYDGQHVRHWRIDLDQDVQMLPTEDAFGNLVHNISYTRPLDDLGMTIQGEIETREFHGVVQGGREQFPVGLYLRETPLTQNDSAIRKFAEGVGGKGLLDTMHKLMAALHCEMDVEAKIVNLPAPTIFAAKRGASSDIAHVFIAATRSLGVPARFIAGYALLGPEDQSWSAAPRCWAEAFVEGIGWVGFDSVDGISPSEAHIRVSMALDYLGGSALAHHGARDSGGAPRGHGPGRSRRPRRLSAAAAIGYKPPSREEDR